MNSTRSDAGPERRVYVVAARRTPVTRVGGALASVGPETLAAAVIRAVVDDLGSAVPVDQVLLGNAVGPGGNLARLALLEAGLPATVAGTTVDGQCGSGLVSVALAAAIIRAGEANLVLAGGTESCSRAPWKVERPPSLYGSTPPRFLARAPFTPAAMGDPEMGEAAEDVAAAYGIRREEQDAFAATSHRKFGEAVRASRLDAELAAVRVGEESTVREDEAARNARDPARIEALAERLPRLQPVFRAEGTVTAGNACGVNDGAALVALASGAAVARSGWTPLAEISATSMVGVDPRQPGIGPAPALRACLQRAGWELSELDLVEINEAFAGQVLACVRELGLPLDHLNVGGGALAFGHPYAASGAIILVRLVRELQQRNARRGAAAIAIGGGMGAAVLVER